MKTLAIIACLMPAGVALANQHLIIPVTSCRVELGNPINQDFALRWQSDPNHVFFQVRCPVQLPHTATAVKRFSVVNDNNPNSGCALNPDPYACSSVLMKMSQFRMNTTSSGSWWTNSDFIQISRNPDTAYRQSTPIAAPNQTDYRPGQDAINVAVQVWGGPMAYTAIYQLDIDYCDSGDPICN
jgi:hypothetical protein